MPGNPIGWILLAAACTGAAAALITSPPGRGRNAERIRRRRRIAVPLLLSIAVLAFLGAAIDPEAGELFERGAGYVFVAATAVFLLGFRFRRSIGLPLLFLLSFLFVAALLFLQPFTAFTGETEIGRIAILSAVGGEMDLEITLPGDPAAGERFFASLDGRYFAPVVEVVIPDDFIVLLGGRTLYRFLGVSGFDTVPEEGGNLYRQSDRDFRFPDPPGISAALYDLFERFGDDIPGIKSVQIEMDLKRAWNLRSYSLLLQSDGGLQIVEIRR